MLLKRYRYVLQEVLDGSACTLERGRARIALTHVGDAGTTASAACAKNYSIIRQVGRLSRGLRTHARCGMRLDAFRNPSPRGSQGTLPVTFRPDG
jgi:hypothetical protein